MEFGNETRRRPIGRYYGSAGRAYAWEESQIR
jgi:hypothetical protein